VIVFGLVAAGLIGVTAARASTASCRPTWGAQPLDHGTGNNALNGVATISKCKAWAVGVYSPSTSRTARTLIEQWDGKAWKLQRSQNPGGPNGTALFGAAATSSTNAWAVGDYNDGSANQTVIEHWNGRAWKVQPSPDPGGSANDNALSSVAAVSPTDAWAVGYYSDGISDQTLILHWNGKKWKVQPSPVVASVNHRRVSSRTTVGLSGVAAASSNNVWAVGFHFNGTANQTLIEHWNGTKWRIQRSVNPGGSTNDNSLSAVTATSSGNAWAVGDYFSASSDKPVVEHWNGKAWKFQKSPNPGGSSGTRLNGVAATSSSNAWAVGDYGNMIAQDPTVVEHWNGKRWTVQPSLDVNASSLLGVAATSATNAWAVGFYFGTSSHALALHCC
jgi:hypothetical protein